MAVIDSVRPTHSRRADAGEVPTRAHISRSLIARMLWGAAPEFCSECGVELHARDAYRFSTTEQYCSIAHAVRDRA